MAAAPAHRAFGPTGIEIPIVGQGTWNMGIPGERSSEVAALRRGIELGLTHIDTAEMYGNGQAEVIIAEAIAGVPRDRLFLVSKVLPQNATYRGTIAACEASLRRLKTDYLDVFLLHWRGRHPLAETVRALEDLVDAGKIRGLGVSNFDVPDLEETRALATRHSIVCDQVLYNLRERYVEGPLLAYCERHGIALVGYSPFGTGNFPSGSSPGGRTLGAIAARQGPHITPRQIALAFLTRRAPLFAIPKAARIEHVEENAKALGLLLTDSDLGEIEDAFPPKRGSGGLPMG